MVAEEKDRELNSYYISISTLLIRNIGELCASSNYIKRSIVLYIDVNICRCIEVTSSCRVKLYYMCILSFFVLLHILDQASSKHL